MLFNSLEFLFFFIFVTFFYFVLPYKYRWILLLLSSCYFYMAFVPIYILILGFTIVIDYYAGILIEGAEGQKRKMYLLLSLIANIGVLAIFKYYNFLNDSLGIVLKHLHHNNPIPYLSILLPIGLSFHTFQAMSYTIEVYRGNQKAERHFGIYSLYVMFYPQLVAGPIERPQNLLYQFHAKHDFNYQKVTTGLKLMTWGLFKKVVIADRLAIVVNNVYSSPENYNSLSLIIATIFFSFQIYCDFSGYSDMAIGSARIMGFDLMKNFDSPYQSSSISEFWKRWHISLSTWFKDYLYISLGGNRVSIPRWYLNLFIVFWVSGLWHGANWTFIIWGALHGFYMVFGLATAKWRNRIANTLGLDKIPFLNVLTTFFLVSFAWIFFRADSFSAAVYIIHKIVTGLPDVYQQFINKQPIIEQLGFNKMNTFIALCSIVLLETVQYLIRERQLIQRLGNLLYLRWFIYYAIISIIIFFGRSENHQFIYFQF